MPKKSPETIGRKKKLSVPELKFNLKPQSFHSLPGKKRVNSMSFKKRPQSAGKNKKYIMGKSLEKDVSKALSTGVGVAEDMGSLGMKVGKTAVKDVEGVGKRGLKLGKRGTKVGMKVGKTAVKDVEDVGMEGMKFGKKGMKFGKKMLTMKKKKSKSKSTKGSYRAYLSKRLKEVKKAHPSWPQSKVFKEAVKGWKSSK